MLVFSYQRMKENEEHATSSRDSRVASFESTMMFNNVAGGNISPGPMTLVSNFFADGGEDYKSFSQLLAGAERSSGDESSGGFRFPAGFLDSPGRLFSPGQAAFGMMHQQAPVQVTNQFPQSQAYTFHIPNDHSSSMSQLPVLNPTMTKLPDMEQRLQPSSLTVDKPDDDGYNWRKYGQKQVKGSDFPRSYYKCTHPSCPVKKKVERAIAGQITEIIYKGEHNHQRPQSKRHKDSRNQNGNVQGNHDIASQAISRTSDSEEVGDAGVKVEDDEDEPDAKRRNMEVKQSEAASSHWTVTEPRIIVQMTSEVDLLDDGYRWRKYGQKVVKGNPYPRSYYKCTFPGCNVRKHVERAATDPKAVITTYEGKHNHDVPVSKSGSYTANNKASNLVTGNQGTQNHASVSRMDQRNNDREPVARLRLKEEQIT